MRLFIPLYQLGIQGRIMVVIALMSVLQIGLVGGVFLAQHAQTIENLTGGRALAIAQAVAQLPDIRDSLLKQDASRVQQLVEPIRQITQAEFIVVGDATGRRLSHPIIERIGGTMVGGDNEAALQQGKSYISKAVGTLGPSIRGKTPVFSSSGNIIGLVSVGYLQTDVDSVVFQHQFLLYGLLAGVILLAMITAVLIATHIKRAILGLEPEEITRLYQEQSATLQSVSEGILALDSNGLITQFNLAAVNTLQLPKEWLTSKLKQPVKTLCKEGDILLAMQQQGKQVKDIALVVNDQPIIVNGQPIPDGGMVFSFRCQDEMSQLAEQLSQVKQYSDTLRVQSHEYSNKLHTLAGLIQLGEHRKALALIKQETSGVQAFMSFLRNAIPDPELAAIVLGHYHRAKELGVTLLIEEDSYLEGLPATLDRMALVTILGNLVNNAFEAALQTTEVNPVIKLGVTDSGNEIIFEVEDNGTGIPDNLSHSIFEKGTSTKSQLGHGIGLYLVKQAVERLKGMITIEAASPTGTRFVVYIPK
ncbi:sensor histidine kinase [Endozoicomonas sp. SM1973]|uniref:histidine kinase n=1 Tax=Spartinivicinus marinus TaxID=2994442 RepID=A0A853HS89_9GAMM|nr:sensor histidine kinase [Spartinivicinus marinus]MCX4030095.1 sensor histidine kinase [Spartinivicinus marinus]NYZ64660.1 sensor histidine kinase [Spartinivicinus marinus]